MLAGTLLAASGCFTHVPAELEAIPDGEPVRVLVTRTGLAELMELGDRAAKGRARNQIRSARGFRM